MITPYKKGTVLLFNHYDNLNKILHWYKGSVVGYFTVDTMTPMIQYIILMDLSLPGYDYPCIVKSQFNVKEYDSGANKN